MQNHKIHECTNKTNSTKSYIALHHLYCKDRLQWRINGAQWTRPQSLISRGPCQEPSLIFENLFRETLIFGEVVPTFYVLHNNFVLRALLGLNPPMYG